MRNVVSVNNFSKTVDRERRIDLDECFLRKKKQRFFWLRGSFLEMCKQVIHCVRCQRMVLNKRRVNLFLYTEEYGK